MYTNQQVAVAALVLLLTIPTNGCGDDNRFPKSPDGKYEAVATRSDSGVHYQVKTVASGDIMLTTHGQFTTPNDVKAGRFDADARLFAAAYHYGHGQRYTWIGVFEIASGKQIREVRLEGYVTAIPDSVFQETK